jgi:very-short-patch-repair endonuclease
MEDTLSKLKKRINAWKKSLLDMSKRNRLLYYKPYRVGTLKFDERLFDYAGDIQSAAENLINKGSIIEFPVELPVLPEKPEESSANYETKITEYERIEKQRESIKQRSKALEIIRRKIKTENDERGINVGYLAVGFLKWYEREDSRDAIESPLIMIPVKVENESRLTPYVVSLNTDEEITINPIIRKKIEVDFGLSLEDEYDYSNIAGVFEKLKKAIQDFEEWGITNGVILDTFSFQNLVIYNDLDKNEDLVFASPFGRILVGESISDVGLSYNGEDINLKQMKSQENTCILETDSSQLEAIYRAHNGESFVVQGPPGTGKSQTIANIIAEQLYLGKKVLFVSEKQAALDVVYRKLELKELSDFCLVMHSIKQGKADIREQLRKSWDLAQNKSWIEREEAQIYDEIDSRRGKLNLYDDGLHSKLPSGVTPYFLIGELANFTEVQRIPFSMPNEFNWDSDFFGAVKKIFDAVENYAKTFIDDTHHFDNNYWQHYTDKFKNSTRREVEEAINEIDVDKLKNLIRNLKEKDTRDFDHKRIIDVAKTYIGELSTIPFSQANTDNIKNHIEDINSLKRKIQTCRLSIDDKNKEMVAKNGESNAKFETLGEDVQLLEQAIQEHFTGSFLDISNGDKLYKILKDKYDSLFKRMLKSKEYKNTISKIRPLTIKKIKYNTLMACLEDLAKVREKKTEIKEAKIQIMEFNRTVARDNKKSEEEIIKSEESIKLGMETIVSNTEESFSFIDELLGNLDFDKLAEYQSYADAKALLLNKYNLVDFVCKIEDKNKTFKASEILNIFKKRYFTLCLEQTSFDKKYHNYTRSSHDFDVSVFREYDRKSLDVAKARIRGKLLSELREVLSFNTAEARKEARTLERELKKKRRLMPTRKLIENLPAVISSLKPCMLMSPLTVSSYFGANTDWKFDVVIFDEASQVKPEYAISAIVRGKQIIVAGDEKQMPPTRFFSIGYDDDYDDYNEKDDDLSDLESILDELSAVLPNAYLNWHYRSKDEALIAFSNKKFYEDKLLTFPNAYSANRRMGVKFEYCENGVWESKNGNKNEAEKVALIVLNHVTNYPGKSLGVVAFGKSQEYAILEAVNKIRDMHPEAESFFSEIKDEPFFIKNLENVQGDERDVIVLSCGYGKDQSGKFAMRFGPLATAGGGRRLNVAVSRAKYQMIVVSSFKASEIRETDKNANRKLLRDFIDYAEHGISALVGEESTNNTHNMPEFDSDFEENVYSFLIREGYKVRTQVGSSGYKIDMAVLHPEIEGRFVLAIECDGAAYHSSRTARDRDILRQEVLESKGWKFYRIWSTNWLYDNATEKKLLLEAVNDAIKEYS